MRERGLVGENAQLLENCEEAGGESRDFENGGVGKSAEKKRNRLTEVMPEVGAFGFVESEELRVFGLGRCGEAIEFEGGAFADFGRTFDTDAKMPGIRGEPFLKRGCRKFGRFFFGLDNPHKLRADEIDRGGANWRFFDEFVESESVFVAAKREDEAVAHLRRGKRAEIEPRDDREGAERSDEKLVEIVAGDIFDDAAAAFAEVPSAVHKLRADEEVAGSAIGMTKRGVDAGSNDAADGGFKVERDRERDELFLLVKGCGEVVEIGTGIYADCEIAWVVMDDLVEAGHVEGDVATRRRHADFEFGAMAAGDEGKFFECGEADDLGDLFGGVWFGNGGRNDFVNGVLRTDCWIGGDVRSADGGFQASTEARRRTSHGCRGRGRG